MTTDDLLSEVINLSELAPDARVLAEHLRAPDFSYGIDMGWWRELRWTSPHIWIAVSAAERAESPSEYVFRFECTMYPHQAPIAVVWDIETHQDLVLSRRPTGLDHVGLVFRTDWEGGRFLYTPLDRHALSTHPEWLQKHPRMAWTPAFTITRYLTHLHDLLHSRSYTGVAGA